MDPDFLFRFLMWLLWLMIGITITVSAFAIIGIIVAMAPYILVIVIVALLGTALTGK